MSKQEFDFNESVSVNLDPSSNAHTLRQLTEMGLTLDQVNNKVRSASTSMAEHYYEHALQVEREVRSERGTVFKAAGKTGTSEFTTANDDDKETIRVALGLFRSMVNKELIWLKSHKGWERDKLPGPCDAAIRKICNGWENNFSLEVLRSVSKIGKANSDRSNEKDAEILAEYGGGAQEGEESTTEASVGGSSDGDLGLESDPEYHAYIMNAVKALDAAFKANPHQATSQAEAVVTKCDRIVKNVAAQLAKGAAA